MNSVSPWQDMRRGFAMKTVVFRKSIRKPDEFGYSLLARFQTESRALFWRQSVRETRAASRLVQTGARGVSLKETNVDFIDKSSV
ncbi:hypothetical protein ElyMa_002011000 [Elysia marginata]|uniref:FERM domain-containing protein n=1 Tax=Elysia marginata TaxID=1093978 RepID=A0AAV4F4J2_9GAST|nr:hypothetical protein ElyMa_002011000 [Elysia marginata]